MLFVALVLFENSGIGVVADVYGVVTCAAVVLSVFPRARCLAMFVVVVSIFPSQMEVCDALAHLASWFQWKIAGKASAQGSQYG